MRSFSDICNTNIKRWLKPLILGKFSSPPLLKQNLSSHAQQLIDRAFANIQPEKLIDYHAHLIGTNTTSTGNSIHSYFFSWRHPFLRLVGLSFETGFGIENIQKADQEALEQLTQLIDRMPIKGKYCLLAFDNHYDNDGFFDLIKSKIHVSNEYIVRVAAQRPDIFIPAISVHPYRADAVDELEKWAHQGVKMIKWMPNAMGMNPMDPRCSTFYKKMEELNLILLTHTGYEAAVPVSEGQELGNPLLLRRALDQNVKVIMAHCATLGKGKDFEQTGKRLPNFELFLRLMSDPNYKNNLYGDISAVTQINRMKYVPALIELSQSGELLFNRLVNGSDYPLPVFNLLISTKLFKRKGLITEEESVSLNEIFRWNPLLFDFVLKRTMRHPESQKALPPNIFMVNENLIV